MIWILNPVNFIMSDTNTLSNQKMNAHIQLIGVHPKVTEKSLFVSIVVSIKKCQILQSCVIMLMVMKQ